MRSGWIGKYNGAWAFPVYEKEGNFVGVHELVSRQNKAWIYDPKGIGAWPLVHGRLDTAQLAFVLESSLDWLTFLLLTGQIDGEPPHPIICSRGAGNFAKLRQIWRREIDIIAIPQNDDPGRKWLENIRALGVRTLRVVQVPEPIHDLNDWLRADLTREQLHEAIEHASIIEKKHGRADDGKSEQPKTREQLEAEEEESACKLEAQAEEVARSIPAYYDQQKKEFVLRIGQENYQTRTETQFKRELRFRNQLKTLFRVVTGHRSISLCAGCRKINSSVM